MADAYKRLNIALEEEKCDIIESIGYEASNQMSEVISNQTK